MVWINQRCQNYSAPAGSFGGARCTCWGCEKERIDTAKRKQDAEMMTKSLEDEDHVEDLLP